MMTFERGNPMPFGATVKSDGINFAVFSRNATKVKLLFFENPNDDHPSSVFEFDPGENRTGDVWHVFVRNAKNGTLLQECRLAGKQDFSLRLSSFEQAFEICFFQGNGTGAAVGAEVRLFGLEPLADELERVFPRKVLAGAYGCGAGMVYPHRV